MQLIDILRPQFTNLIQLRLQFLSLLPRPFLQLGTLLEFFQQIRHTSHQFLLFFIARNNRDRARNAFSQMRLPQIIIVSRLGSKHDPGSGGKRRGNGRHLPEIFHLLPLWSDRLGNLCR